jgi:two-component system, NarL family, sensor kinase
MKHHLLIPLLLIQFSSFNSLAQKTMASKEEGIVDEINAKAWKIRNNELQQSYNLAIDAIYRANKINYQKGLSYSYNVLGHYYKVKSLYDSSLLYYTQSLDIRQRLRDTIGWVSSCRNVMSILKLKGDYVKAIEVGRQANTLLVNKLNDKPALLEKGRVLNNLSALYLKLGNFNDAIKNALEAKKIFFTYNEDEGLAATFITLGNIYEQQQNFHQALLHLQEAIRLHTSLNNERELAKAYNSMGNIHYAMVNFKQAISYYKLSLNLRTKNGFNDDLSGSFYNIGNVFAELRQYDSAFNYFNQSLSLSYKSGNKEGQYEAHRTIAETFNAQYNYTNAIYHLRKAYTLSTNSEVLQEKLLLFKLLANTYKGLNKQDSALFFLEAYDQLNDSINMILRKSIALESQLKGKEYELNLSKEKNYSQMLIIVTMAIILGFFIIVFVLIYRSNMDRKGMRKLQDVIKEQEFKAMDAMLEGQENERKRLSRELHDTIGSILTATKYAFKSMEDSIEKLVSENKNQYYKINGMLDEAMETVRRISHDMASGIIIEKGIEEALSQLCQRLEISGKLKITLTLHGFDEKVDPIVELELYRIIQELLTNTLKHANAKHVQIQLTKGQTNINLILEDDGIGFKPQVKKKKTGIGLSNVAERIKKLSGKWSIDSNGETGTTVTADIPINNDNS